MQINSERLKKRIETILAMSEDSTGGYTRLAFSDKDIEARTLVKKMMEDAGLNVREDAAGNILGTLSPNGADKGYIATGSHIDTVRNGGKFDGLFGSIAAIEAAQCINENKLSINRPLEVIIFADEEGARFNSGMLGSKSIAGIPLEADMESFIDKDGIVLSDALRNMGIGPERVLDAAAPADKYKAFVELHIEQSIVLEQEQKHIGIVDGIKGPFWVKGCFEGESNHAGGTPMNMRRDALVAAANFAAQVDRIAKETGGGFVATVGVFNVYPGGINTIPNRVEFTIDIRDIDMQRRKSGIEKIWQAAEDIALQFGVTQDLKCIKDTSSEAMDTHIMKTIASVCDEEGSEYMELSSGAFHDALTMTHLCDVGMIFVPSIGGVSHSPQEDTRWEDIFLGAQVLYKTVTRLLQEKE